MPGTIRIIANLSVLAVLAACATPQLYPGDKMAAGETAALSNGNTHYSILLVDGLSPRAVKTRARPKAGAVPAGPRRMVFFYKSGDECRMSGPSDPFAGLLFLPFLYVYTSDCRDKAAANNCVAFEFEARAGHAYELSRAAGGRIQLKDSGSGKILTSRKPIATGNAKTLDQIAAICSPSG